MWAADGLNLYMLVKVRMSCSGVIVGLTALFNSLITGASGYNLQVSRLSYTGMTFVLILQCRARASFPTVRVFYGRSEGAKISNLKPCSLGDQAIL